MQNTEILISTILIAIAIALLPALFIVFISLVNSKRQLQQNENFDKKLLLSQLEAQEEAFQRISEELHDNVGQLLALAKLNLVTWEMNQEFVEVKIDDTIKIIGQTIGEIRKLSKNLNADYISHNGLLNMVEYFIRQLNQVKQYTINLYLEGEVICINKDRELMIFRIIQEAFHNIIKHSGAKLISIFLFYKADELELKITDDGSGFNVTEALENGYAKGSSGLQNIIRRIKAMNGKYEFISNNNKGTLLCITIPI